MGERGSGCGEGFGVVGLVPAVDGGERFGGRVFDFGEGPVPKAEGAFEVSFRPDVGLAVGESAGEVCFWAFGFWVGGVHVASVLSLRGLAAALEGERDDFALAGEVGEAVASVAIGFHVPLLRVTTRPVFFAKKGGAPVLPVAVSRA